MVINISVLIDSSVLVAFANEADQNHNKGINIVGAILSGKYGSPVISDYIFSETVTVCLARTKSIDKTKSFGEYLLTSEAILVRVNDVLFNEAWKIFCKSSKLSFTDATNLTLITNLGITHLATFDKNLAKISDSKIIEK